MCAENGASRDTNGAISNTAAASAELAEAIAAEAEYLKESLGGAVVAESARPHGSVVIGREATSVQLPSGGSADVDVVVAAPAAAVATGAPLCCLPRDYLNGPVLPRTGILL
jgi:hypothetical protein